MDAIFRGYKWDPQYFDNNTIAKHVLIISEKEHQELAQLTEKLTQETISSERFLVKNLRLSKNLKILKKLKKYLSLLKNYNSDNNIRLMRFDFHPIENGGWAISEVNSDVPGGFAESSILPQIALDLLKDSKLYFKSFSEVLVSEITKLIKPGGTIAFIHCTSYSDDRQMMQVLGDKLKLLNYKIIYAAADHLKFVNRKAFCVLDNNEGEIDMIFRFTPLEWMLAIKKQKCWHGYFNTSTPSCNHPVSIFTQTKRFPLIWDLLENNEIDLNTWRALLPETLDVRKSKNKADFIYKPTYGRVGEGISIREACKPDEYSKILKHVKRKPNQYIAQKRFAAKALTCERGEKFHVCLGAYSINGKAAGYYARLGSTPRIDSNSADIPVLIERSKK